MNLEPVLSAVMDAAEGAVPAPEDYIDPADGLRHCGRCRAPKERYFPAGVRFGGLDRHPAECLCAAAERARREREQAALEHAERVRRLRAEAFRDIPAAGWRFDRAAVMTPQLQKVRAYTERWDSFAREGIGLLLFGSVGTGKSYAAGCAANALLDREIPVVFTGMADVVDRMQGRFSGDRDSCMKRLMGPELLILDDLGAERNTAYGKERVFDVVNHRLLSGKPMIITSNIPLSAMQKAADLDDRRVFDRILEVCVPVQFNGENFRRGSAAANLRKAAALLRDAGI